MDKRIAIFVKNLTSGGAEKQAVLLAKSFADDMNVYFIVFNGNKVHDKYLQMMEGTRITVKLFYGNHLYRFYSLIQFLKIEKIEIVFSYLTAANLYACMACMMIDCKVVTGLRNAYYTPGKRFVNRFLTNYIATKTVVNCYSGLHYFVNNGFKSNKICAIPNCFVDITPYVNKKDGNPVKIITVGRFSFQKDYESAIHAISLLKEKSDNFTYDIVGYGDLENAIRDMLVKYKLETIVTLHINPDNIAQLLNDSDVYFSTSLFEGTSNSIMEAMNANLPIVATDVGDNAYLVQELKNGFLVKVKDVSAMSNSLLHLIENPKLRHEYGLCSKQILHENYSEVKFKRSYCQLIKQIASY